MDDVLLRPTLPVRRVHWVPHDLCICWQLVVEVLFVEMVVEALQADVAGHVYVQVGKSINSTVRPH
jgi:hypothetical protein